MKLNIAVLAGDGIGPEIMQQAIKVVNVVCEKKGHEVKYTEAVTGAAAIDAVGDPYPIQPTRFAWRLMQYFSVLLAIQDLIMTLLQRLDLNKVCYECVSNLACMQISALSKPSLRCCTNLH